MVQRVPTHDPQARRFDCLHGSTEQVYCEQQISFDFIELEQNWALLKVKMLNRKKQKIANFRFLVTNGNPKSKLGSKRKREKGSFFAPVGER
jgi:hypothetical protein